MKVLSGLRFLVEFCIWCVVVVVICIFALSYFSQQPYFPWNVRLLVVRSGSMEPTIMTGDVILIRRSKNYGEKDVVTFIDPKEIVITHRIVKANNADGQITFTTKGDNNHAVDPEPIRGTDILGKWFLTIPYLGYGLVYFRSPMGLIVFVSFVVAWLISEQVWGFLVSKRRSTPSTGATAPPPQPKPSSLP